MGIVKTKKAFEEEADKLILLALNTYKNNSDLANRYAEIAYRILTSHRIRFGDRKFLICKKCRHILIPGRTAEVKFMEKSIKYKCLNCNKVISIHYEKRV